MPWDGEGLRPTNDSGYARHQVVRAMRAAMDMVGIPDDLRVEAIRYAVTDKTFKVTEVVERLMEWKERSVMGII